MLNLCRRALAALPADEVVLAARIGVRLAAEQVYDGAATAGDVAAAVDRVRRLGDPFATAEALSLYHHALLLPEEAPARLQVADELLDVASNAEATMYSLAHREGELLPAGRFPGHDAPERARRARLGGRVCPSRAGRNRCPAGRGRPAGAVTGPA